MHIQHPKVEKVGERFKVPDGVIFGSLQQGAKDDAVAQALKKAGLGNINISVKIRKRHRSIIGKSLCTLLHSVTLSKPLALDNKHRSHAQYGHNPYT